MSRRLFQIFPFVHRLAAAASRRFTPAGRLLGMLLLGAAVFGADPRETHAYRLAALLTCCFAIAAVGARRARPRVSARRELPAILTAHEAAGYYLLVTNDGEQTEYELSIQDELAGRAPDYVSFRRGLETATEDNWFDRRVGFLRYVEQLKRARGAVLEPITVPHLRPGQTARLFVPLLPLRIGRLEFAGLTVARTETLGLMRGLVRLELPGSLIAAPRRHPVPPIAGAHDPRSTGRQRLVRSAGSGDEFFGLRDYRPGDPERHLHWRSFAKRGQPVVKQFADRFRERLTIVVDCFQPIPDEATFEAVLSVAASLATVPRHADCEFELLVASDGLAPLRAVSAAGTLVTLACLPIAARDDWGAVESRLRRDAGTTAPCFVITSVWDPARAHGLAALAARQPGLRMLLVAAADSAIPTAPALTVLDPTELASGLAALGRVAAGKAA